ncbi:ABC transporter permease [Bdellovibrionota bacterium FG-1]
MLEFVDVHKTYQMGENTVFALRGVSLTIEEGDFVAIMGPSGSGKSTLMHVLGLLDVPSSGSYRIDGKEVSRLTEDELAIFRRGKIGFIFQQFNLLPRMTAVENVALPLLYSEKRPDLDKAKDLLGKVGLGDRLFHKTNELSGGQQQRVAIARSLVNQPKIILADEPTGNLDSISEKEIMGILKTLNSQGITIVIVTHEEEIGAQAKRRIRMRDGVVQSDERLVPMANFAGNDAGSGQLLAVNAIGGGWMAEFFEHLRQGFKTLAANKVRTALSMLGILIGVAAVVAMLAIGKGAQTAIENQLASLGSNLLVLRPGAVRVGGVAQEAGSTTRLTAEDTATIKDQISTIREVSSNVNGRGQVAYRDKNWSTQVLGASGSYARMHASEPEVGRFFLPEENLKRSRVAVIGATVVRELFGTEDPVGATIKINRVGFQVIGILPEKGANGFRDQDDIILIPVNTAMKRLFGKNYVDYIDIEVGSSLNIESAQKAILELMASRHKLSVSQRQDAFQIRNMADIQAALSESSKTMSLLLACIAAISLLVGGIGIMNIMLVSVTERTREIGLRKAVGARRWDILSQFLMESVVVSAVGGVCGIFLGWLITVLLTIFAGWPASVSPWTVLMAFGFSATIGVVFGSYPAKKASALHPIDALRYE